MSGPIRNMAFRHFRGKTDGFTLIEVLVALLILLIGLLGVVGMQLISVQNNQGAYLRTQATYIASDFMDRIRANRVGQDADAYDAFDTSDGIPANTAGTCATSSLGCTAVQLANQDQRELTANFLNVYGVADYRATLPSGSAQVDKVALGGTTNFEYIIRVSWNEKGWEDTGSEVVRADSVAHFVELRSVIRDK